ncbi:MAG: CHAD domain-containing protein [Acidobacteria bacterium]|nr:CHAD domain-containing protein [Acidobacteriota bacterium]MCL5289297.1 CHAD domain-containing protein [Acidobacteriota bacterium]
MVSPNSKSAQAAPSSAHEHSAEARHKLGFGHWMRRVLAEHNNAAHELHPDTVHDLRVALRRCRSMADGLMELDSDRAWRDMKKAGRKLFRRLGELRDTHVMIDWVKKLEPPGDVAAQQLLASLHQREWHLKQQTTAAVTRFDRAQWKVWAKYLNDRAVRVPLDGPVFQHIALQRWQEAYNLHRRALRNRSRASWHRLRIGVKRFRYTIENFLPGAHAAWGDDLKHIQDLLGEVHDLDMLWTALARTGKTFTAAERARWHEIVGKERQARLEAYREKMMGPNSLWNVWRTGLPQNEALESSGLEKLSAWAGLRDPEVSHSRHVARLALNLFDGLAAAGLPGPYRDPRNRLLLHAAALMHNVGHTGGRKGHHKESYRLIRTMSPPIGWSAEDLEIAALIARYHRGAWPRAQHAGYSSLQPIRRETVLHLGGILRLAAAFDHAHTQAVRKLHVQSSPEALFIWAEGYRPAAENARILAAERHLLERALRKPVLIRPRPEGPHQMRLDETAMQVA